MTKLLMGMIAVACAMNMGAAFACSGNGGHGGGGGCGGGGCGNDKLEAIR
jgi:hypothetical protein